MDGSLSGTMLIPRVESAQISFQRFFNVQWAFIFGTIMCLLHFPGYQVQSHRSTRILGQLLLVRF